MNKTSEAYTRGWLDFEAGCYLEDNPYNIGSQNWEAWHSGYRSAKSFWHD